MIEAIGAVYIFVIIECFVALGVLLVALYSLGDPYPLNDSQPRAYLRGFFLGRRKDV